MATNSKISWTHHTFNPWRGCQRVSPGCQECYAEKLSKRNPAVLGEWGPNGTRVIAKESYWREPIKWNKAAVKAGERHRVFCASLADWLEDRPELRAPRARLLKLTQQTPNLDYLMLSKRPNLFEKVMLDTIDYLDKNGDRDFASELAHWVSGGAIYSNIWLGTTVESDDYTWRIDELAKMPAGIKFVSMEPLLLDKSGKPPNLDKAFNKHLIHQLIVGGESQGPTDRRLVRGCSAIGVDKSHTDCPYCSGTGWEPTRNALNVVRSLRDQCKDADVAFHFKQWGGPRPESGGCLLDGAEYKEMPGSIMPIAA